MVKEATRSEISLVVAMRTTRDRVVVDKDVDKKAMANKEPEANQRVPSIMMLLPLIPLYSS